MNVLVCECTYLCPILITDEESVLDLDNADHVAVLNFFLLLGEMCLLVCIAIILFRLLRSAQVLLLLIVSLHPLVLSQLGGLRAL